MEKISKNRYVGYGCILIILTLWSVAFFENLIEFKAINIILFGIGLIQSFLFWLSQTSLVKDNETAQIDYRVTKKIFNKHVHDAANKLQVLMGQQLVLRNELKAQNISLGIVDDLKMTMSELTAQIKHLKQHYFSESERIILPTSVKIVDVISAVKTTQFKKLNSKRIQIIDKIEDENISVLVESETFKKYVVLNLLKYAIEKAAEDSTVFIIAEKTDESEVSLKIRFSETGADEIKSMLNALHTAKDTESPLTEANDFVRNLGGRLKVQAGNDREPYTEFALFLKY